MRIILLVIVVLFLSDRSISFLRTKKLKYLAEKPESQNYIVQQLTTDEMLDLWFNEHDSTCIIKTGDFDVESAGLYRNIKYWTIDTDGHLLSVAEAPEEIRNIENLAYHSFSLTKCFQQSWYGIEGVSYQENNPDKSSIRRQGYHRKGLVYRGLFDFSLNPTGNSSGNYWGATSFFKMKHNGEIIRFKEYSTLRGLISFIDTSTSIKLYCPTQKTKIIWLEYLNTHSTYRNPGRTYKYDRPEKNRGVYVVVKK